MSKYARFAKQRDEYCSLKRKHTDEEWHRIEENRRVMENVPTRRRTKALVDVIVGSDTRALDRLQSLAANNLNMYFQVQEELRQKAVWWIWMSYTQFKIPKDMVLLVAKKIVELR